MAVIFLFLMLYVSDAAPSSASELRAGAARACITPPIGTLINGDLTPFVSRHVHDDLYARAIVLDNGSTRLAFVVVDICLLDRATFDEAKKLVRQQTGLAPEQVMMSCTHTHSAGSTFAVHLTDANPTYRASLPIKIADAVRCAVNSLAPAQIGWGSGSVPQHVFCRRVLVKPGVVYTNQFGITTELAKMNWNSPHPADGDPAGPVDPEVSVLSIKHADGRPLALLANYSLHYVGDVAEGDISADYFGVFSDRIQQLLGADRQDPAFVGILCNGTSGDINNWDPKVGHASPAPYTRIKKVADDVAREVLRVEQRMKYQGTVTLRSALAECAMATRRPDTALVKKARAVVKNRPVEKLHTWQEDYAREQILLSEYPAEVSMPLQVFRIGDLAIAGWPGEAFAATGLSLKQQSQVKPMFNIGLANGCYGYIPPPEQFRLGAYETWRMRTSYLETNAIPKLTAKFLELLQGLK